MSNEDKEFRIKRNQVALKTKEMQLAKLDEMVKNFPRFLNKRTKEFSLELKEYIDENSIDGEGELIVSEDKIPMFQITQHAFKPLVKASGFTPLYGASEMSIAFDYYMYCTEQLNKYSTYIPKIEDFCRLMGISTDKFTDYMTASSDENMREICKQILNYCTAVLADAGLTQRVDKVYAIFHQKSSNKQRDNDPVQFNNFTQNNTILTPDEYNEIARRYINIDIEE